MEAVSDWRRRAFTPPTLPLCGTIEEGCVCLSRFPGSTLPLLSCTSSRWWGLGAGSGARRKGGEGSHYFLAGNTLTWPVIGLAMFAANISTVHLVSLAETAYKYGLVFGNFEWMAGFTLILLSLFFAPLYLRSRVPTLPDYLERRYNRHCRDCLAFVSLFSADRDSHRRGPLYGGAGCFAASWPCSRGHDPRASTR